MFEVEDWCSAHPGKCTFDGTEPAVCIGGCEIPLGKTLRVPIAAFASEIVGRQQLGVAFFAAPADFPSTNLHVFLDGRPGRPLPAIQDDFHMEDIAFDFSPFPATPVLLELRHSDGNLAKTTTWLFFMDYACYQANPRFDCGV